MTRRRSNAAQGWENPEHDDLAGAERERGRQPADRVLVHQPLDLQALDLAPVAQDPQRHRQVDVGGHVALPEADHDAPGLGARQHAPPGLERRLEPTRRHRRTRRTASLARRARGRG